MLKAIRIRMQSDCTISRWPFHFAITTVLLVMIVVESSGCVVTLTSKTFSK